MEHLDKIRAMANLASTYQYMGKYTEAEKLEIQKLWMQVPEFLEWNTPIQLEPWEI